MEPGLSFNAIFLCVVNVIFMIAGISLNTVVISSLRGSSQIQNKLWCFTIVVLSCFDLIVVCSIHPLNVVKIIFLNENLYGEIKFVEPAYDHVCILIGSFSMLSFLILTIVRFLALAYPFFHQTSVTKSRLGIFQAILITSQLFLVPPLLHSNEQAFKSIYVSVTIGFHLSILISLQLKYRMLNITQSKRKKDRVSSSMTSSPGSKRRRLTFKSISTCSQAIGCFSICYCPQAIYCISYLTSVHSTIHSDEYLSWAVTLLISCYELYFSAGTLLCVAKA